MVLPITELTKVIYSDLERSVKGGTKTLIGSASVPTEMVVLFMVVIVVVFSLTTPSIISKRDLDSLVVGDSRPEIPVFTTVESFIQIVRLYFLVILIKVVEER